MGTNGVQDAAQPTSPVGGLDGLDHGIVEYRARVRGTKVTLTSPRSAIFAIGSGRSSRSKKRRRNWPASHSMFHCASATNSRLDAGRIVSVRYSGGAGSSGRTTPL